MLTTQDATENQTQILELGRKLAAVDPSNAALAAARAWWAAGCWSPDGEDVAILAAIKTALKLAE